MKPQRKDWQRSTKTYFKKTYGKWIYTFQHDVTEIPGYTSAMTVVRRKKKGDSALRIGELVHLIHWEKEG